MPTDYLNGKIYMLYSLQEPTFCYIGSTTQLLSQRFTDHRRDLARYVRGTYHWVSSFSLLQKYDDVCIELIENFPCNSREELRRREGHYQRKRKCVNKFIAGRTDAEYREDNKEKILAYYRNRAPYRKEKIICECGRVLARASMRNHTKRPIHSDTMMKQAGSELPPSVPPCKA